MAAPAAGAAPRIDSHQRFRRCRVETHGWIGERMGAHSLSRDEQDAVLGANAARFYGVGAASGGTA
jgi:hypothetical protein